MWMFVQERGCGQGVEKVCARSASATMKSDLKPLATLPTTDVLHKMIEKTYTNRSSEPVLKVQERKQTNEKNK